MKFPAEFEVAVQDGLGVLDAGSPAEIFAEGHGPQGQRADTQSGAAERHIVVKRHEIPC